MNTHGMQNAQEQIGHQGFFGPPECPVLQPHVASTGDQCRQIGGIMSRAAATSKQHNGIVEYTSL